MEKDQQSPVEYSTKFLGNSDSEEKTPGFGEDFFFDWSSPKFRRKNTTVFKPLAKTFIFFGFHSISSTELCNLH